MLPGLYMVCGSFANPVCPEFYKNNEEKAMLGLAKKEE